MGPPRMRRQLLATAGSLALAGCGTTADETDRDPYTVEETVPPRPETLTYLNDPSTGTFRIPSNRPTRCPCRLAVSGVDGGATTGTRA